MVSCCTTTYYVYTYILVGNLKYYTLTQCPRHISALYILFIVFSGSLSILLRKDSFCVKLQRCTTLKIWCEGFMLHTYKKILRKYLTFLYGCLHRFLVVFMHPFSILTWKGLTEIVYNLTSTGTYTVHSNSTDRYNFYFIALYSVGSTCTRVL